MQVYETARLRVRYLDEADLATMLVICSDPVVMRYMGSGEPLTADETALWIHRSQANYADHGYGCMAAISKEDGGFAGFCGLVTAPGHSDVEIIYALARPYWGRGLAAEMAGAMLDFGFAQCGLPAILATIDPRNTASVRIVEQLGMTFLGERPDADGAPVLYYQMAHDRG